MGFTASAIHRMRRDRHLFSDKEILTLGFLQPYLNKSQISRFGLLEHVNATREGGFSSSFMRHDLGARSVESLDIDGYQGADIICNLNNKLRICG